MKRKMSSIFFPSSPKKEKPSIDTETPRAEKQMSLREIFQSSNIPKLRKMAHDGHTWFSAPHKDKYGNSLLHTACLAGRIDVYQFAKEIMAQNMPHTPKLNKARQTPLFLAAHSRNIDLLIYIIKHELHADTSSVQENVQSTMEKCKPSLCCMIEFLLTIQSSCEEKNSSSCQNIEKGEYRCCCCEDIMAVVDSLLPYAQRTHRLGTKGYISCIKRCVSIKQKNFSRTDCFSNAAGNGHLSVLEYLVLKFPKTIFPCLESLTLATKASHFDVIVYLVENVVSDADFSNTSPQLLSIAALKGRLDIVQYFIKKGVPNNYRDGTGKGNLHMAACSGNTDVMQILIDYGSTIDEVDKKQETSLHYAVLKGAVNSIRFLHEKGDPSFHTRYGDSLQSTCLMGAAMAGRFPVFELLVELGCDPTEEIDGNTCLLVAATYKHSEIMSYLISLEVWSETQMCTQGDLLLAMIAKTPFYPFGHGTWDILDRLVNNGWITVEGVREQVNDEFYEKLMARMREKRTRKRAA